MFNAVNGNGATVTEKLGLDSEVRELKFGSSFNQGSKGQPQGGFHTIRYDFKPASVDTSKMATLEVGPSGQVTISMPHFDTSGNTVFKGSTKPYTKECVLIIDKDTGEVVLEKLSHNVQVKKTRQEGGSRSSKSGIQPAAASGFTEAATKQNSAHGGSSSSSGSTKFDKSPPTQQDKPPRNFSSGPSSSSSGSSHLHPSGGLSSSSRRRPNSPMTSSSNISRHSPKVPSPGRSSPSPNNANSNSASTAFDALISSKSQQQSSQNSLPSLTSIEDLLITPPAAPPPPLPTLTPKPVPKINVVPEPNKQQQISKPDKMVSDSSSDSSSSSSSDEDDDDDSSMEEVDPDADPDKFPLPKVISGINDTRRSASPAPPMMNMSMPSFSMSPQLPHVSGSSSSKQFHHTPSLTTSSSSTSSTSMSMPSMPSNILSQDLQLSESGSDSDD